MGLSAKHRAFVSEYLSSFNATRAAERAGYKGDENTLAVTGHRLLRNNKVAAAIRTRLNEKAMSADEVLMRLGSQARGSMADFIRFRVGEEDGEEVQLGDPVIDLAQARRAGVLNLIKRFQRTETVRESENGDISTTTTLTIELYDAQSALKMLATHHKLLSQTVNVNVNWKEEVVLLLKEGTITTADVRAEFDDGTARELFKLAGIDAI